MKYAILIMAVVNTCQYDLPEQRSVDGGVPSTYQMVRGRGTAMAHGKVPVAQLSFWWRKWQPGGERGQALIVVNNEPMECVAVNGGYPTFECPVGWKLEVPAADLVRISYDSFGFERLPQAQVDLVSFDFRGDATPRAGGDPSQIGELISWLGMSPGIPSYADVYWRKR